MTTPHMDLGEFVTEAISAMGVHCAVTTTAAEFWAALTSNTDLILLDLLMPDIDGVEMLRLLARRRCTRAVYLASGPPGIPALASIRCSRSTRWAARSRAVHPAQSVGASGPTSASVAHSPSRSSREYPIRAW